MTGTYPGCLFSKKSISEDPPPACRPLAESPHLLKSPRSPFSFCVFGIHVSLVAAKGGVFTGVYLWFHSIHF